MNIFAIIFLVVSFPLWAAALIGVALLIIMIVGSMWIVLIQSILSLFGIDGFGEKWFKFWGGVLEDL